MCGVIGIHLKEVSQYQLSLVNSSILESMIRGKHATGITYVRNNKLVTESESKPANEFMSKRKVSDWVNEDGGLYCIIHTRYSTSDLRYNQPLFNKKLSIAHNGVISQESKEFWKYDCETNNDSELILRSLENENEPLLDFPKSSMSVVSVKSNKELICFRNGERPLYSCSFPNGIIFVSTADIAKRSGLTLIQKCEPFVKYKYKNGLGIVQLIQPPFKFEDLQ